MKIENSQVNMASSHNSYSYTHVETAVLERRAGENALGAVVQLSEEGARSYRESIKQFEQDEQQARKDQQQKNMQNSMRMMAEHQKQLREANGGSSQWDFEDLEISIVKKILAVLNGEKLDDDLAKSLTKWKQAFQGMSHRSAAVHTSVSASSEATLDLRSAQAVGNTQVWQRITATEGTHLEYENTTFASEGIVQTADGRSLNFNVEVTLGRDLSQKINSISCETITKVLTDPLVINLDHNITSVSDRKFTFDLDSDGKEEDISFAGEGSGFLALDRNNDGTINDGSELFGTKSGDGFADLAAYDDDKNGWIDENDSIFSRLKVWTKDEQGNDRLLDLQKADVGAIYLGNTGTEFSFKDMDGSTNGVLRKTGIYLKESTGAAGTIAHVDLAL